MCVCVCVCVCDVVYNGSHPRCCGLALVVLSGPGARCVSPVSQRPLLGQQGAAPGHSHTDRAAQGGADGLGGEREREREGGTGCERERVVYRVCERERVVYRERERERARNNNEKGKKRIALRWTEEASKRQRDRV